MVSSPLERFMKLEKIDLPKEYDKKGFEIHKFTDKTYYQLYDECKKQGIQDFKIFHIRDQQFWIVQNNEVIGDGTNKG